MPDRLRRVALAAVVPAVVAGVLLFPAQPSHAATTWTTPDRVRALRWAENYRGCWYSYGHTGPCSYGFDCSGLVYEAYRHQGYAIPRTTYGMLDWRGLWRIWRPRPGDLAFYGSGHVELVTRLWHTTFGAHHTGTRIGWVTWGYGWAPTEFFRVRGAGLH